MMNDFSQAIKRFSKNSKERPHIAIFFMAVFMFSFFQPLFVNRLESGELSVPKDQKVYSIWLVPEGGKREFYQKLIEALGREHKGPIFVPHITVLGNIRMEEEEVLLKLRELAGLHHPLSVTLNEVAAGNEFYRCVFAKAEKTPSLLQLYTDACRVLEITPEDFMPHLSLLYGEYDMSLKKKIAAGIEIHDTLYLDSLFIYETSPNLNPQDWRLVGKIPFDWLYSSPILSRR